MAGVMVHGVASPEEAARFVALGADVIGVVLGAGGRAVDDPTARAIRAVLGPARLCVEGAQGPPDPDRVAGLGAALAALAWGREAPGWAEGLARAGVGRVLARVPADEDDDPAWVAGRIAEAPDAAFATVELCPGLADGWPLLTDGGRTGELTAADLDALAARHPLRFSGPFRLGDVAEIRATLPHAAGWVFALADGRGAAPGAHPHDPLAVAALLPLLRG